MPRVSVVMPSFNCARYIGASIESVLKQSCKDLELIIVDGGSTDATDQTVAAYASDVRVRYEVKRGAGISAARNEGIRVAKAAFIAFLDADDLFTPGHVEKEMSFLERSTKADICYSAMVYFNDETGKELRSAYYPFSGDIFYFLKRSNFIHPSALMARRIVFRDGLFDETLPSHEDWELWLRLSRKGMRFLCMREPLTRIRVRPMSTTTNKAVFDRTRHEVGLMAKRYWVDFKSEMVFSSPKGIAAIARYMKFKIAAALIGFPKRACFHKALPAETLL